MRFRQKAAGGMAASLFFHPTTAPPSPDIIALKPGLAAKVASSLGPCPTGVSTGPARRKSSVSAPGIRHETATPGSFRSLRSAMARRSMTLRMPFEMARKAPDTKPAIGPTRRMRPRPAARMRWPRRRIRSIVPVTLPSTTRRTAAKT